MNAHPFLAEGFDGSTPLKAYCLVMTPDYLIIDSIYPHSNISICVSGVDGANQFGDNTYTRHRAIRELINLDRMFHGVKHFYHRYKAVLKTYTEIESMEYDRYNKCQFASTEERSRYLRQMHQRLKQIYVHYLQRAIPEIPITEDSDLVIQPYLLKQILRNIKQ